jgi:DNA-binding NarL/FixJ family response regulator
MTRVVIVDDQQLIREGLKTVLSLKEGIQVVGIASDGKEALEVARREQAEIVLMDIRMPRVDGIEGTRLIRNYLPQTKVLILTTFDDVDLIFQALNEGASGYLLKDMEIDAIYQAILTVKAGGMVLPPELTTKMVAQFKQLESTHSHSKKQPTLPEGITEREYEVLKLLGLGLNNREIAERLFIAEGTVKNYVSNLISKLGLRDRTQLAIFAVKNEISP